MNYKFRIPFSTRSPAIRTFVLGLFYTVGLTLSLWFSYLLRFDFAIPELYLPGLYFGFLWVIPFKLILLILFRQFDGLLSYFSVPDLQRLFFAIGSASLILMAIRLQSPTMGVPPRGVILTDFVLSLMGLAATRLSFRVYREKLHNTQNRRHRRSKRVGIIGAGDVGASLVHELNSKKGLGLMPVAIFDDNRSKWRSRIHDIPVIGSPEKIKDQSLNLRLDEVIIAMPSAPAKRVGEVVKILQQAHLKFETVPSIDQLATGQVKVTQLRSVEIQDLLGRDAVKLETENIREYLEKQVVMVTGAGGSIGSELCRQIAIYNPQRLLLVEQSEVQIYLIEQELIDMGYGGVILSLVADILDGPRMRYLFDRFRPQVVFHAAAHKHVPMMESQPSEAIQNNTIGTRRLAELSAQYDVKRFVMISTDKAINPTNVMGATKRLAEIFLQAFHAESQGTTKLMAVRFGNVLGSSGSVIPTFQRQIAAGGPVKVTHPDITRYFMTIPESVGLVLQSAALGNGGEIFVLDMGQPVKIVDLAKQLIELNGLRPYEDIDIEFVGMRPGEKLFEELSYSGEQFQATEHSKILRFISQPQSLEQVCACVQELQEKMYTVEPNDLKKILQTAVPEYVPYLT